MKTILIALVWIFSIAARALPVPPTYTGSFKFSGPLKTINTLKKEVVYTSFSPGLERFAELRQLGFTCVAVFSTTYSCTKNTNDSVTADVASRLISNLYKTIEFGTPLGDWELVNTAEFLTEFVMNQQTTIGENVFTKTRYLITPDIQKLVLVSENGDSLWFNIYNNNLNLALTTQKTLSNTRFESYLVEALFPYYISR